MPATPLPADLRALAPGFAASFALILTSLYNITATALLRNPRYLLLIPTICARINRVRRRFAALMALLAAGKLPRAPRPGRQGGAHTRTSPSLPKTRSWLVRALGEFGYHANGTRSQLAHLLAQPALAELLAAAPEAADRILNPLRRMIGMPPFAPVNRPVRAPKLDPRGVPPPPYPPAVVPHIYVWPRHPEKSPRPKKPA